MGRTKRKTFGPRLGLAHSQRGRGIALRKALLGMMLVAATLDLPGSALAAAPTSPATLSILIKPAPVSKDALIDYVDVTENVDAVEAPAGAPLLTLPLVSQTSRVLPKSSVNSRCPTPRGVVSLTIADDPDTDPSARRRWLATRAVHGTVTIHYRAPIDNAPQIRGSGPPFGLRTEAGGFSGIGQAFVVLPVTSKPYRIALRWDLTALGPQATAMSSFGDGDLDVEPGPVERVFEAYFMAGRSTSLSARKAAGRIRVGMAGLAPVRRDSPHGVDAATQHLVHPFLRRRSGPALPGFHALQPGESRRRRGDTQQLRRHF